MVKKDLFHDLYKFGDNYEIDKILEVSDIGYEISWTKFDYGIARLEGLIPSAIPVVILILFIPLYCCNGECRGFELYIDPFSCSFPVV